MSSNLRELSTVLLALQQAQSAIAGRNIHLFTDHVLSAAYVNRFGGSARHLDAVVGKNPTPAAPSARRTRPGCRTTTSPARTSCRS